MFVGTVWSEVKTIGKLDSAEVSLGDGIGSRPFEKVLDAKGPSTQKTQTLRRSLAPLACPWIAS